MEAKTFQNYHISEKKLLAATSNYTAAVPQINTNICLLMIYPEIMLETSWIQPTSMHLLTELNCFWFTLKTRKQLAPFISWKSRLLIRFKCIARLTSISWEFSNSLSLNTTNRAIASFVWKLWDKQRWIASKCWG
mgnify:CR=1 FL=1